MKTEQEIRAILGEQDGLYYNSWQGTDGRKHLTIEIYQRGLDETEYRELVRDIEIKMEDAGYEGVEATLESNREDLSWYEIEITLTESL